MFSDNLYSPPYYKNCQWDNVTLREGQSYSVCLGGGVSLCLIKTELFAKTNFPYYEDGSAEFPEDTDYEKSQVQLSKMEQEPGSTSICWAR